MPPEPLAHFIYLTKSGPPQAQADIMRLETGRTKQATDILAEEALSLASLGQKIVLTCHKVCRRK